MRVLASPERQQQISSRRSRQLLSPRPETVSRSLSSGRAHRSYCVRRSHSKLRTRFQSLAKQKDRPAAAKRPSRRKRCKAGPTVRMPTFNMARYTVRGQPTLCSLTLRDRNGPNLGGAAASVSFAIWMRLKANVAPTNSWTIRCRLFASDIPICRHHPMPVPWRSCERKRSPIPRRQARLRYQRD